MVGDFNPFITNLSLKDDQWVCQVGQVGQGKPTSSNFVLVSRVTTSGKEPKEFSTRSTSTTEDLRSGYYVLYAIPLYWGYPELHRFQGCGNQLD